VLFLNKADIFREQIKRDPLQNHFPHFRGEPRSV
jgi:hypothetical protein